jgi:hypothetical protein
VTSASRWRLQGRQRRPAQRKVTDTRLNERTARAAPTEGLKLAEIGRRLGGTHQAVLQLLQRTTAAAGQQGQLR